MYTEQDERITRSPKRYKKDSDVGKFLSLQTEAVCKVNPSLYNKVVLEYKPIEQLKTKSFIPKLN